MASYQKSTRAAAIPWRRKAASTPPLVNVIEPPENGEPVLNKGFQNWNLLVLNMMAWLDGKPVVSEF